MDWLSQHARPVVDSLLYSVLGTVVLLGAFALIERVLPPLHGVAPVSCCPVHLGPPPRLLHSPAGGHHPRLPRQRMTSM